MSVKNIAFIIGHLSHGGAEKQLYLICKHIDKHQYHPIVFCLSNAYYPWGKKIESLGIKVIYIARLTRFDISRVLRLTCHLYVYHIDIIVSALHIGNVYAFMARSLYFRRSIFICQIRSKESSMKGFSRWLNIRALNASDHIVLNSNHLIRFVKDFFQQDENKLIVIYNAIEQSDKPRYKYEKDRPESKDSNIHIGIIGKDSMEKNIQLFIDTGIELLKKNESLFFHLCGRDLGSENRFLPSIPDKMKGNFTFYGEIDDVPTFLSRLDIYLSTSNSEGLPNAIMEAMLAGLPVVATNVGGVSELIKHNVSGFLVEVNGLDRMVYYSNVFIEDKSLRRKMGQRGMRFIQEHFHVDKMMCEFEQLFNVID